MHSSKTGGAGGVCQPTVVSDWQDPSSHSLPVRYARLYFGTKSTLDANRRPTADQGQSIILNSGRLPPPASVSGNNTRNTDYLRWLCHSCSAYGEQRPTNLTAQSVGSGVTGVLNRIKIYLGPLRDVVNFWVDLHQQGYSERIYICNLVYPEECDGRTPSSVEPSEKGF